MYNFSLTFIKNESYEMNTMCEGYEIPEKEVAPNKKLEKEKQSNWHSALIDSK